MHRSHPVGDDSRLAKRAQDRPRAWRSELNRENRPILSDGSDRHRMCSLRSPGWLRNAPSPMRRPQAARSARAARVALTRRRSARGSDTRRGGESGRPRQPVLRVRDGHRPMRGGTSGPDEAPVLCGEVWAVEEIATAQSSQSAPERPVIWKMRSLRPPSWSAPGRSAIAPTPWKSPRSGRSSHGRRYWVGDGSEPG